MKTIIVLMLNVAVVRMVIAKTLVAIVVVIEITTTLAMMTNPIRERPEIAVPTKACGAAACAAA